MTYDLAIVGGGLVGSALACALANHSQTGSLRIALIEASEGFPSYSGADFDPRVVALTHASQQLLQQAGAWQQVATERLCPYSRMYVWDAAGTGSIEFDAREVRQPCLGHIVENSVITNALMAAVERYEQIELFRPQRVESLQRNGVTTQLQLLDDVTIEAKLIVAADGANSKIRQWVDLPTREWDYQHTAIVTTVRTEQPHQYTAWQRFIDTGPLAFLPLQTESDGQMDDHYSSIVWSTSPEQAERLMALDDQQFCAELSRACEAHLGEVSSVAKRFSFPLRQRHAIDYFRDNVVLVGDAAHTIHPLAGQGVNLGFLDVAALRDELVRTLARDLEVGEPSLLKRYQRQRKSHNLSMMAVMEGFKRLFGSQELPVRWARNEGMRQLNGLGPLKNVVIKQAMGL